MSSKRKADRRRSRWTAAASLLFVLALIAAACGNGEEDLVEEDTAAVEDPAEEPAEVPEEAPEEEPDEAWEPEDNITLLIGFGAGGGNDLIFRMMSGPLGENLGVSIGADNMPGGGGVVAMTEAVGRDADGLTMVSYQPPTPFISHLRGELPFEPDALTMIGAVNQDPSVIAVPGDSPYETLEELIEAAQTEQLTVGHTGVTGMAGLSSLVFRRAAGIELVDVAYDSGGDQEAAVLGGEVDVSVRAGGWYDVDPDDIRILAVMAPEEIDELPGVPTVESIVGQPATMGAIRGLAVRSDTPPEIIATLQAAFEDAANRPEIRDELLDSVGFRWEFIPMDEANALEAEREEVVQELFDAGLLDD